MSLERIGKITGLEPPELLPLANTATIGGVLLTVLSPRRDLGVFTTLYGLGATLVNRDREQDFRDKAWRSYEQDVELSMEWGTATQSTKPPEGNPSESL